LEAKTGKKVVTAINSKEVLKTADKKLDANKKSK
jgi:hypothetical protein